MKYSYMSTLNKNAWSSIETFNCISWKKIIRIFRIGSEAICCMHTYLGLSD